jgi:hypothetical protein
MTTKACLEGLIKYLAEEGHIDKTQKAELIATLYRGNSSGSS